MVRTEIQLFLENVPGELGKLTEILADEGVNIDALTIQDAVRAFDALLLRGEVIHGYGIYTATVATAIATAILHYRLELPLSGQWWLGAVVAMGAAAAALALGARYILRELRISPATHLRGYG